VKTLNEIYVSTDIEVDGPIPGFHSMLSLGSVALLPDKTILGTFSANLELLPGATGHPDTMKWWAAHPEAWTACRRETRDPGAAMADYAAWIEKLPGPPVFVGYPAAFDFMHVYWYLMHFAGRSPFSFSALDIKTMAMTLLRLDYRKATKKNMPKRWFDQLPHNHVALNDAMEQGMLFCNILAESRR
jgi:hypothetical protein